MSTDPRTWRRMPVRWLLTEEQQRRNEEGRQRVQAALKSPGHLAFLRRQQRLWSDIKRKLRDVRDTGNQIIKEAT